MDGRLLRGISAIMVAVLWISSSAGVRGHAATIPSTAAASETGFDWPKYEHDITGSGDTSDPGISASNASTLALRAGWPMRSATGTMISAQPIVADGYVFWGSWDGVEHGTPVNGGAGAWSTELGTLTYPSNTNCAASGVHGVGDAGVVADVAVGGVTGPVLFLAGGGNDSAGGGSANVYALDALTGAILWQTDIAPSPNDYLWSSPVFYQATGDRGPSIYEGVADVGEPCPLVQGELVQLDALTGQLQHTFDTAPAGCTGATVWGSLTVDEATNAVYAVTGNRGPCNKRSEPYAYAIVKLDATTLGVIDSWQIPKTERASADDDFGTVPILFSGNVNGHPEPLVGAANKNGIFYIWNRNDLAAGPVYRLTIANPHAADIAPPAFDGSTLYIGTTGTMVNGVKVPGSVRAFEVADLPTQAWVTTLPAPVLASVTAAPGIVVVGAGHKTWVLDATTGSIITSLQAKLAGQTRGRFWAAPTIADGVLYEGDTQGYLYAYTPGGA